MTETKDASTGGPASAVPFPLVLLLLLFAGLLAGRLVVGPPVDAGALATDLGDPSRRTIAYMKLLELGPDAVPALLEVVRQPASPGRGDALELLGRIGDARGLPAALAVDDPRLQNTRLEALGRLRGEAALAEVLAALRGGDPSLQFPALRSLAEWHEVDTARLLPDVEPFLEHELGGLREFAVRFMGARRHAPAVPALIARLRDDEAPVRQAAAWALSQVGTQDAVAAVDSAMKSGAVLAEED